MLCYFYSLDTQNHKKKMKTTNELICFRTQFSFMEHIIKKMGLELIYKSNFMFSTH